MRNAIYITLLLITLLLGFAVPCAWAEFALPLKKGADFLPVDEAFQLTAERTAPETIQLRWFLMPGYYLYRDRLQFGGDGVRPDEVSLPEGVSKEDEYFGEVQVYFGELIVKLPVDPDQNPIEVQVRYQGCAEAGYCYPPQKRLLRLTGEATLVVNSSK